MRVNCPCWIGEDPDLGECFAIIAYGLDQGRIRGVDVSGLNLVLITHIPGNVLAGNWEIVALVDERATPEQRDSLVGRVHRQARRSPGRPGPARRHGEGRGVRPDQPPGRGRDRRPCGSPGWWRQRWSPTGGPDGSITTLQDSVFSTVPGSPAWVAKASVHRVNLPQYGMTWEYEGRNAIQSEWKMEYAGVITGGSRRGQWRRVFASPPGRSSARSRWPGPWPLPPRPPAAGRLLGHDELIHSGLPLWAALGLHLLAWQANGRRDDAAIEPPVGPAVRDRLSSTTSRAGVAMSAFLTGYAVVWSVFGALAFLGDVLIAPTWSTQRRGWRRHPAVIGGGVLALAGAFQFSSLKDRCLKECRHPGPGSCCRATSGETRAAFRLGRQHGLFCLGCCWALMLVGFAAGVANLGGWPR